MIEKERAPAGTVGPGSGARTALPCLALTGAIAAGCGTSELQPWHEASLDSEFTASMEGEEVRDLDDYVALEERLFAELRDEVSGSVGPGLTINRFSPGSLSDPARRRPNWNRTQELAVESPRGGVLMLHGLTDSPYTMRSLGTRLADEGFHVVALRLPAHGTAPSALGSFDWQDVSAAVRVALRDLGAAAGDAPVHLFGSTAPSSRPAATSSTSAARASSARPGSSSSRRAG